MTRSICVVCDDLFNICAFKDNTLNLNTSHTIHTIYQRSKDGPSPRVLFV